MSEDIALCMFKFYKLFYRHSSIAISERFRVNMEKHDIDYLDIIHVGVGTSQ